MQYTDTLLGMIYQGRLARAFRHCESCFLWASSDMPVKPTVSVHMMNPCLNMKKNIETCRYAKICLIKLHTQLVHDNIWKKAWKRVDMKTKQSMIQNCTHSQSAFNYEKTFRHV